MTVPDTKSTVLLGWGWDVVKASLVLLWWLKWIHLHLESKELAFPLLKKAPPRETTHTENQVTHIDSHRDDSDIKQQATG